jgi:hypothetical protein
MTPDEYPRPVKFEYPTRNYYSVCKGNAGKANSDFRWLSLKHGWLLPLRQNVRFYSRFKTREAAERAINRTSSS